MEEKWKSLKKDMEFQILTGVYTAGMRLPSCDRISVERGLARGTVQRTYREMEQKGLILRKSRDGTFVKEDAQKLLAKSYYLEAIEGLKKAIVICKACKVDSKVIESLLSEALLPSQEDTTKEE